PTSRYTTLSLHDALPIFGREHGDRTGSERNPGNGSVGPRVHPHDGVAVEVAHPERPEADGERGRAGHVEPRHHAVREGVDPGDRDRKSTRLNSSHQIVSY